MTDIDSAILRTCRTVYNEALYVLYEQNTFHFSEASAIKRFKVTNLLPMQALSIKTGYGRLALIRCISLKITADSRYESPIRCRKTIWSIWMKDFFSGERSIPPHGCLCNVGFPALQKVVLSFKSETDRKGRSLRNGLTGECQIGRHLERGLCCLYVVFHVTKERLCLT